MLLTMTYLQYSHKFRDLLPMLTRIIQKVALMFTRNIKKVALMLTRIIQKVALGIIFRFFSQDCYNEESHHIFRCEIRKIISELSKHYHICNSVNVSRCHYIYLFERIPGNSEG